MNLQRQRSLDSDDIWWLSKGYEHRWGGPGGVESIKPFFQSISMLDWDWGGGASGTGISEVNMVVFK